MATSKLRVFYGTSHPELGKQIVKRLGLRPGKIRISRFACGEIYARILENIRGQDCVIIQTCNAKVNEDLMELFMIIDALKRASAKTITVVIPHFGYARQDRRVRSYRVPISARIVADMLSMVGISRVMTVDLHADQIQDHEASYRGRRNFARF